MCSRVRGGLNPPPCECFPQATLGTAWGKKRPCSSGEGLFVCLLGQNISEKVVPGVRSKFLEEIQKHQP